MITSMREKVLKSNAFKILVWLLILVLALPYFVSRSKLRGGIWVAKVNGQEVGGADYSRKINFWKDQLYLFRQQYGQYAEMFLQAMGLSSDPTSLALDSLIRDELIDQEVERLGIPLHADYIREKLADASFVRQE